MSKPELVVTGDGSHSLYVEELNEHYHSTHGAIQESVHVFIEAGFADYVNRAKDTSVVKILEVGFGTGLNAFLTAIESEKTQQKTAYTSYEAYPISIDVVNTLNYPALISIAKIELFKALHIAEWENTVLISPYFQLQKIHGKVESTLNEPRFNIIYFDAFAPEKQPELWTEELFQRMFDVLENNGRLVTYCAKGVVKRTLKKVGFLVESLPGPPGKREMVRAIKVS